MGGAAAGEIASQMATEIVLKELRANWIPMENPSPEAFARCLKQAVQKANTTINGYASSHQEFRGMGTTCTMAGLLGDTLYLCQVGDSRGYLVRDGVTKQITKDQSLMQKLIEAGELTEEEAAQSERRNIILQALGPEPTIKVDLTFQRVQKGDILVLCSDGLSGQIRKDDITEVTSQEKDLVQVCRRLIELANQAGGPDNITVICARFDGAGLEVEGSEEVAHRPFHLPEAGMTPPMPMDRISEGPTAPMRPSQQGRNTVPLDPATGQPMAIPLSSPAPGESPDGVDQDKVPTEPVMEAADPAAIAVEEQEEEGAVDGERKSRGKAIMIALLVLLIAAAAWFGFKTFKKVKPETTPPTPAATTP
jgi:protein phosphatase